MKIKVDKNGQVKNAYKVAENGETEILMYSMKTKKYVDIGIRGHNTYLDINELNELIEILTSMRNRIA